MNRLRARDEAQDIPCIDKHDGRPSEKVLYLVESMAVTEDSVMRRIDNNVPPIRPCAFTVDEKKAYSFIFCKRARKILFELALLAALKDSQKLFIPFIHLPVLTSSDKA